MIQRIQTIYLFGIIAIALLTCTGQVMDNNQLIPATQVGDSVVTGGKSMVYVLNSVYFNVYNNGVIESSKIQFDSILLVAIIIGWTLNIIFGFKDRAKQMKNVRINFIFLGVFLALYIIKPFILIPNFGFGYMSLKSTFGMALVIFMLYINLRALLLIKKDDNLVKSADRIR